jgi:hypothetical protein
MQQPHNHHLAQLNIGRIRYEIDDPRIADFASNLALANGIGERSATRSPVCSRGPEQI